MALKSSQPRRSASPKSERPILRTTKGVETPNTCNLGLANTVAIAPASLPVVAVERRRPNQIFLVSMGAQFCSRLAIAQGKQECPAIAGKWDQPAVLIIATEVVGIEG